MDLTINNTDTLYLLFSNYLKNNNLRNTAERDAIFSAVCQTKDPFTLDMIWQQLEDSRFHVSRASIYNTMELLLAATIVVRHQFAGVMVQYELKHIADQYNYTICKHCGTIRKIKNDKMKKLFTDYKIPKFTLEHYSLQFYGICSKCKFRIAQKEKQGNKLSQELKDEKN